MTKKKERKGFFGELGEKVFGTKDRTENYTALERLGIKFTIDWHLMVRIERMREMDLRIYEETDIDKKLMLDKRLLDEMSIYGVPGDDPIYFEKNVSWQALYSYYLQGKLAVGLGEDLLSTNAIELHYLANVTRTASIHYEQIFPNTPIVIMSQPVPGGKYSGGDSEPETY